MRTCVLAAMVTGLLAAASQVTAGGGCVAKAPSCQAAGPSCGCNAVDPTCGHCHGCGNNACGSGGCDACGDGCCDGHCGCGLFGRKCGSGIEGLDRFANCGCNGSYNYPVPPLYTYHWPGMYKQVRMTDYHSPWRFPPLRKYEDEPLPTIEIPAPRAATGPRLLKPVSLEAGVAAPSQSKAKYFTEIEPLSSRLSR
jgi:hypothetical protein